MTSDLRAATLPGGLTATQLQTLSPDALSTLSFYTGVDSVGAYAPDNGWLGFGDAPHKWGGGAAGSAGGVVSYYFDPLSHWTPTEEGILKSAMALWSDIANISFAPAASAAQATYTISRGAGTNTYTQNLFPGSGAFLHGTQAVESVFDTSQYYWQLSSFSHAGGDGVDAAVHEMGHMLGLSHTGNYNGGASTSDQRDATDSQQWSIMSYFDPATDSYGPHPQYQSSVTGTLWGFSADGFGQTPTTWMPLDVLAMQRLYGAPTATALSGGQTFGFNCNVAGISKPFFDFTQNTTPIVTLWDAGGGNTLDVSGFGQGGTVDLNAGHFSSVDGLVNNIGIAYFTRVDGAVGGGGNELFIANGDSDRIAGGGGADTVAFTAGGVFYGQFGNAGAETVATFSGLNDTLTAISELVFSGGADTVSFQGSATAVLQGTGDLVFGGGGVSSVISSGSDTVVAGGGGMTLDDQTRTPTAGDLVFSGGGSLHVLGGAVGTDTIVAGNATLNGGSGAMLVFGNQRDHLLYTATSGAATVVGATGSETVTGFGLFVGGSGGGNRINVSGLGQTTAYGGGNGDSIRVTNGVSNVIVGGPGAELIDASHANAGNELFAGGGADTILGSGGNDQIVAGRGDATLTGGGGSDLFVFADGGAGGHVTITDWLAGSDQVYLDNYGAGADAAAYASEQLAGSATTVTLSDRTTITFLGIHGVQATAFV